LSGFPYLLCMHRRGKGRGHTVRKPQDTNVKIATPSANHTRPNTTP
jgi:hypothetical protein